MRDLPNTDNVFPGMIVLSGTYYYHVDTVGLLSFTGRVFANGAFTTSRTVPLPSPVQTAYEVTERHLFAEALDRTPVLTHGGYAYGDYVIADHAETDDYTGTTFVVVGFTRSYYGNPLVEVTSIAHPATAHTTFYPRELSLEDGTRPSLSGK